MAVDPTSTLAAVIAVNNLGLGYLFVKRVIVTGSELDKAQKQVADLQAAMLDKVIPAVTEANTTMRMMAREPRRPE